jgi:flagellar hook protein FlgE
MMRSLYSGASGLQAHQTKMDVLSNNIANVNTAGFKKGQVNFQDALSQTIKYNQEGNSDVSGINTQQVGLGVMVGAINNVHTQGAPAATGNNTDLMIQGEGYFMLKNGNDIYYSRVGAFSVDNDGYLVDLSNGFFVTDEDLDKIHLTKYSGNFNVAADGTISYINTDGDLITDGPVIGLATFSNNAGLIKAGGNLYIASETSGAASKTTPGSDGAGTLISGVLEMSNVDLSQEFVDLIVAQRGFQANSRTVRTSDEMLQELINMKR